MSNDPNDPTAPLFSDTPSPYSSSPPMRNPGPLLRAAAPKKGWPKGKPRTATVRTEPIRTEDDVSSAAASMGQVQVEQGIRMPRESGEWSPEYDGPGERASRLDRDTNQFELPRVVRERLRNAGWDASYKVVKVLLADVNEVDGTELRAAYGGGWRPAKAKDFPEIVMPGTPPNATIENNGQRLFIRPLHLTHKAQAEDEKFAHAQMRSRMEASQEGRLVKGDEEGLSDMGRIVRPVHIQLDVEGESGVHAGRR